MFIDIDLKIEKGLKIENYFQIFQYSILIKKVNLFVSIKR